MQEGKESKKQEDSLGEKRHLEGKESKKQEEGLG